MSTTDRLLFTLLLAGLSSAVWAQPTSGATTPPARSSELVTLSRELASTKADLARQRDEVLRLTNLQRYSEEEVNRLAKWLGDSRDRELELNQRLVRLSELYREARPPGDEFLAGALVGGFVVWLVLILVK